MKKLNTLLLFLCSVCFVSFSIAQNTKCPKLRFEFKDTTVCLGDTLYNIKVYSNTDAYGVLLMYNPNFIPNEPFTYGWGSFVHPPIQLQKINDTLFVGTFSKVAVPSSVVSVYYNNPNEPILALLDGYPYADNTTCLPYAQFTLRLRERAYPARVEDRTLCADQKGDSLLFTNENSYYQQIWNNDNPGIGLPAFGKNKIPAFTAINNTGIDQIAHITVLNRARDGRNGCPVPPVTFTIKVNKEKQPIISPFSTLIICKGDSVPAVRPVVLNGSKAIRWKQWGNGLSLPESGEGGLPSFKGDYLGPVYPISTYTYFEFQAESVGGCFSKPEKFNLVIRPVAEMNDVPDQLFCNGGKSKEISFTGNNEGLDFRWTIDNPKLGLPTRGLGKIPSKILVNETDSLLTALVTVTPKMPSRIWVASAPNQWQMHSPAEPAEQSFVQTTFSSLGSQVPHPDGFEIYFSDGETAKVGVNICPSFCNFFNPDLPIPYIAVADVPNKLLIKPEGQHLYSINYNNFSITEIDPIKRIVLRKVLAPEPISCAALSEDGSLLYVASQTKPLIWVFNTSSLKMQETIDVQVKVANILPYGNGVGLGLQYADSSAVVLFDLTSKTANARFKGVQRPNAMALAKAVNKLYLYDESVVPNKIHVIDLVTNKVIKTIAPMNGNGDFLTGAYQMAINPTGDQVFLNTYPFSYLDAYQDTLIFTQLYRSGEQFFVSDGDCTASPKTFKITLGNSSLPSKIDPIPTQIVCSGKSSSVIPLQKRYPGLDFTWKKKFGDVGSFPESGAGDIPAVDVSGFISSSDNFVRYIVYPSFKVDSNICKQDSFVVDYHVLGAIPFYSLPINKVQIYCKGDQFAALPLPREQSFLSLRWYNDNPSVGLPQSGTDTIPAFTVVNTGDKIKTAKITMIRERKVNGVKVCPDSVFTFQIQVLPINRPQVDQILDYSVCHQDSLPAITFSGTEPGTIYRWRVVEGPDVGVLRWGNNVVPRFLANAPGDQDQTIKLEVIPVLKFGNDSCVGSSRFFSIKVKQRVIFQRFPDVTFCHNELAGILFPGLQNYQWTFSKPELAIGLSVGTIGFNLTAINNGTEAQSGIFKVSYAFPNQTCRTDTVSFRMTVLPRPELPAMISESVQLCTGETFAGIEFKDNNINGFELQWTNSNPNVGLVASGSGSVPSFVAKGDNFEFIGSKLKLQIVSLGGNSIACTVPIREISIGVAPKPVLASFPKNQTVPNCTQIIVPTFGSNVRFLDVKWTNDNPVLGLPATGTGNIPSFIGSNTSLEMSRMKIKVESRLSISQYDKCIGTRDSFYISVLPSTALASVPNQELCVGKTSDPIAFGKLFQGQTIRWTLSRGDIGLPRSGTGDIPAFEPSILAGGTSTEVQYNIEYPEQLYLSYLDGAGYASRFGWIDKNDIVQTRSFENNPVGLQNLVMQTDGKKIFASDNFSNKIIVLDATTRDYISAINLEGITCTVPKQMAFSSDGKLLFVSFVDCNTILVVNTDNFQVAGKILDSKNIGAFALSPRGFRLYLFSQDGKQMAVANPRSFSILQRFNTNFNEGISNCFADPDGEKMFVLNLNNQVLYRVNLVDGSTDAKYVLDHQPNWMTFVPKSNKVYLATLNGGLFSFDRKATAIQLKKLLKANNASTCVLSSDASKLYVAQPAEHNIFIVETTKDQLIDSINLNASTPLNLLLAPVLGCPAVPGKFTIKVSQCPGFEKEIVKNQTILDIQNRRSNRPNIGLPSLNPTESSGSWDVSGYYLGQNMPNPFNSTTQVPLYVPSKTSYRFSVFSIEGRLIKVSAGNLEQGWHQLEVNAELLLNAGVYYYSFETSEFQASRKMIWLK